MSKRKPIETVEEITPPQALILDDRHQELATYLAKVLTTRGCMVKTATSNEILKGEKFDYIFQLGNYPFAVNLFHKNLKAEGKFLFVEVDFEEIKEQESLPFKVLRVGNSSLWTVKELSDKILKTIFSSVSKQVVDARKGHLVKPAAISKPTPPPPEIIVSKKRTWKNKIAIFSLVFLAVLLLSGGYVFWQLVSFKNTVSDAKEHFNSSDWKKLGSDLEETQKQIDSLKKTHEFLWTLFIPFRETALVKDSGIIISVANNLVSEAFDFIATYQEAGSKRKSGDTFEIVPEFLAGSEKKIVALGRTVDDAKKRIEQTFFPFFPKEESLRFLTSIQSKLAHVSDILPVVRRMFLTDQAKTYLVLFQNNMELRPTGGFIGSFAIMTVQEGKVLDLNIVDVYSADGQLKGHVDPPLPIRKYLAQPNFFLRDSNFDPDFAKSAAQALWFIQKELGKGVDGVIGTNLFFIQELLRLTGQLKIADFNNETVTADNFFFKAQFYAQNDFFPGSTQKKDFLTSVANVLQLKFANPADFPLMDLAATLKNSLDQKNLLFWSLDGQTQNLIEEKGWGGRMVAVECVGEVKNCQADFLSVSEANLGVNKANYFITKSVSIGKEIDQSGNLKTTVILSYENRNIADLLSGGTYTNYLRFFTPAQAVFETLSLNNVLIPASEIDNESYGNDKISLGFLLKIAPENKAVIKIIYTLPSFLTAETSSYQFLFQKQPGDKISPLVLAVTMPDEFKMQPVNFKSNPQSENELYFTTDSSVDRIFALGRQ